MSTEEHEHSVHLSTIRVRYGETDAMGIAHHSSYLAWFEVGRVEFMRHLSHSYRALEESGISFPVIDLRIKYKKPSYFDEILELQTVCLKAAKTRTRFGYRLLRGTVTIALGYTEHATLGPKTKVIRTPEEFRKSLFPYIPAADQMLDFHR